MESAKGGDGFGRQTAAGWIERSVVADWEGEPAGVGAGSSRGVDTASLGAEFVVRPATESKNSDQAVSALPARVSHQPLDVEVCLDSNFRGGGSVGPVSLGAVGLTGS